MEQVNNGTTTKTSISVIVDAILIPLNATNIIFHGIGIYLLACLSKVGEPNIQNMYILNLSIAELLMNSAEILRQCFLLYRANSVLIVDMERYLSIVMFAGISFVFYFNMVFITADRLLHIALNVRYRLYWSATNAKRLLIGTWVIGGLVSIVVSIAVMYTRFDWENVFYVYFYPIMGFAFIILAFVTYYVIFQKYRNSQFVATKNKSARQISERRESSYQVFQRSKFFVPVLLILSFILFMLIPDMVSLVYKLNGKNSEILLASCFISYAVSNLVDALIYIFMQVPVRRLLCTKLRTLSACICCRRDDEQSGGRGSVFGIRDSGFGDKRRHYQSRVRSDTTASSLSGRSTNTSGRSRTDTDATCRSRFTSDASYRSRVSSDATYTSRLSSDGSKDVSSKDVVQHRLEFTSDVTRRRSNTSVGVGVSVSEMTTTTCSPVIMEECGNVNENVKQEGNDEDMTDKCENKVAGITGRTSDV